MAINNLQEKNIDIFRRKHIIRTVSLLSCIINNNVPQNSNNEAPVPQYQAASTGYIQSITTTCRNAFGFVCQPSDSTTNLLTRGVQVGVPETNVEALKQRYQYLIECEDIGNGNYKLSIVDRYISNKKAQKILEAFKDINVVSLNVTRCRNITELSLQNFPKLRELHARRCENLTRLDVSKCTDLRELIVSGCTDLRELDVTNCTDLRELIVSGCTDLRELDVTNCTGLTTLNASGCTVLTKLDAGWCKKLETLNVTNCTGLTTLFVSECENLHGEIDISGAQQLDSIGIVNCAEDFVVVISPECPLAQIVLNNHPHIRIKSIEEQRTSFLIKEEDKHVVQSVINLVRGHDWASNAQKKDFENCLKNYCERYVNASEGEKARAAEKYISALNRFSLYLDTCRDAFATGLARLKIELELGNLLKSCNTAEEHRQVLFGVYAQEQIERSIGRFDMLYTDPDGNKVGELLELQLALNVVLNVPHSENMSYAGYAATVARVVTEAYNANANELRDLIKSGETFLEKHDEIKLIFLAKLKSLTYVNFADEQVYNITEEEAEAFIIPLAIVLTSMLRDDAANENLVDRKFSAFLLGEQEYWPLAAETPDNIYLLTVGKLERFIGETDDTRAIKAFIQKHKGQPIDPKDPDGEKLSDNSTLGDVFFFLENNNEKDNELYGKIANMTSPAGVARLQQQSIGNLYSEANYEARLAEHLQNALRLNE